MRISSRIFYAVFIVGLLLTGSANSAGVLSSPLARFQRKLVSRAAPHSQALHLAAAAILARSISGMPLLWRYSTLIHRAQTQASAGPAVYWVALGDCGDRQNLSDCINTAALQHLQQQAPDNAAIWLLSFDHAVQANDLPGQKRFLYQAARASVFRTYYATLLQALINTVTTQTMPAAVVHIISGQQGNAQAASYLLAAGNLMYLPTPALAPLFAYCSGHSPSTQVHDECLHLARHLALGDTVTARATGLALTQHLTKSLIQRHLAARQQRVLAWQTQQFASLVWRARHDVHLARMLLGLARQGKTENSIQLGLLRKMHIPLTPPSTWNPDSPGNS